MHLKREQSPKSWPVKRKGTTYLVKPSYSTHQGVPILVVMRDMLKLAKTRREVKKVINARRILLNNKEIFDDRNNAVLFDVIKIKAPKGSSVPEKNFIITMGENKKFAVEEIPEKEADHKIAKVINKTTLKGKKTQINLSDGRNFISNMKCSVNDSLLINLKNKKPEKCLPLKKGVEIVVFAGKHAGEKGKITEIDEKNKIAKIEREGKMVNILIKQLMVLE